MGMTLIVTTLVLFFAAALFEIGGGYLVWKWLKEKRTWLYGLVGGLVLFAYGTIPTLQPAHFGRVYAAYGGIFILAPEILYMNSCSHIHTWRRMMFAKLCS